MRKIEVLAKGGEGGGVWAPKNIQKHPPNPTRNRKETTQHCQSRNTRLTASAVADKYIYIYLYMYVKACNSIYIYIYICMYISTYIAPYERFYGVL